VTEVGEPATERYERDGFSVVEALVGPALVDRLRDVCAEMTAPLRDRAGDERYSITMPGSLAEPAVADLVATVAASAVDLLGGQVEPTFVLMHAVTCTLADGRGWHQALVYHRLPYSPDGTSVPLDEIEYLIMLDDAYDDDMAAWFAPGYHVAPMLEHRRHEIGGHSGFELIEPQRQLVLPETVKVPLRSGDAVGYTLGTPHACICARDETPRREVLFMRLGFRERSTRPPTA